MTHNIVAEFSCSIWSNEEEERATSLGFSVGDFKQYQVVAGSVFNGEYNETLDSATIVLSQIPKEDRLSYIKPYDFVRIYDKTTYDEDTGTYGFDKIYLVDNFSEKENNIEEHIFGYTINLMSETKLLEKIQCPSLTITHKVNENGTITKKTIWEKIKEYMELYVPKMKFCSDGENWSYEPLIKFPITYINGTPVEINFNYSNFVGNNLDIYSSTLPVDVDINSVEIRNFNVVTNPHYDFVHPSVSVDIPNRRLKFHGSIANFIASNHEISERFDHHDFTPNGDEYEFHFSIQLGSSYRWTGVSVYSFSTTPHDLIDKSVTYDSTTGTISFYGRSLDAFDGEITVDFSAVSIGGYVTINYRYLDRENDELYKKFGVPCADMGFTAPTFRQLLTTLMLQVGCIPTVHNRTLGFLDFKLDAQNFGGGDYTIGHTVNYIQRSLSSDSYVNSLINISNNVLDSGNEVITEALGFRDKNNAFIKQTENLYLETKLPIYKVTDFVINAYVNAEIDVNNIEASPNWRSINGGDTQWKWYITFSKVGNHLTVDFGPSFQYTQGNYVLGLIIKGKVVAFKNGELNPDVFEVDETYYTSSFQVGVDGIVTFNLSDVDFDTFYFYGYISVIDPEEYYRGLSYDVFACNYSGNKHILTLYSQDITPLLVEKSVRQNLSTDFANCVAQGGNPNATIDTLAQYVYGTVGYDIGSTKIEGFSSVFNVGQESILGWITKGYTYIENIWNFIVQRYSNEILNGTIQNYGKMPIIPNNVYEFDYDNWEPDLTTGTGISNTKSIELDSANVFNPTMAYTITGEITNAQYIAHGDTSNFAYMWFDITYQPLNSFNLAYVKKQESVDYLLQQYDGNASGLTDFDRLSLHEQEQVDRIGNEVLNINQRTTEYSQIQTFDNGPLYFMDDTNRSGSINEEDNGIKYIIFKRSYSIGNNCYNANYTGSKDAVLKDYFTSIRTKYRAYQYVDYNSSTLRKERDTFFVRISENGWYDGDDKVFFGAFKNENYNQAKQQQLMVKMLGSWMPKKSSEGVTVNNAYDNAIADNVLASDNSQIRNEVSIVCYKDFFAMVYEECDNVGGGTYLFADNLVTAIQKYEALNGGIPQSWHIWEEDYNLSHIVSYSGFLNLSKTFDNYIEVDNMDTTTAENIEAGFQKILDLPKLSTQYLNLYVDDSVLVSVVSNNKEIATNDNAKKRTFYKDYAERINHTVQFNYYTDSANILWEESFFKLNDMAGYGNHFTEIYLISLEGKEFELKSEEYANMSQDIIYVNGDVVSFHNGSEGHTNPYIQVNWTLIPNITQFKVVTSIGNGAKHDVIAFKKGDSDIQKFYITLNDTKTDYVMAEKNGILYRRYKVSTNTLDRTVVPIYDED